MEGELRDFHGNVRNLDSEWYKGSWKVDNTRKVLAVTTGSKISIKGNNDVEKGSSKTDEYPLKQITTTFLSPSKTIEVSRLQLSSPKQLCFFVFIFR